MRKPRERLSGARPRPCLNEEIRRSIWKRTESAGSAFDSWLYDSQLLSWYRTAIHPNVPKGFLT